MSIREWVHNREIDGRPSFSYADVKDAFPSFTQQHILNDLYRLRKSGAIAQPFKGYYVVIPPHYAAKGIVPPVYYIDQLMRLSSSALLYLLAQCSGVIGRGPSTPSGVFRNDSPAPDENAKTVIQSRLELSLIYSCGFLKEINSETGTIKFSGPELTALDLIQYEQHVGGLSRAATVIEELSEQTVWRGSAESGLLSLSTVATVQRLGYILENVLMNQSQADDLYHELKIVSPKLNRFRLSTRKNDDGAILDKRWNIIVNTEIEIDDL